MTATAEPYLRILPCAAAQVYENYAELVLNESARPTDILRDLMDKLEIRKFELTQPSLNAIFLDVVGGSSSSSAVPAVLK